MNDLRISFLQFDIAWEDKQRNLEYIKSQIHALKGKSNLLVLPEMFTTGFTNNCHPLAESMDGPTIQQLKQLAHHNDLAIAGSLLIVENNNFYNRFVFIHPTGDIQYYDKKHLFRLGAEVKNFTAGKTHTIVSYLGWHIALQVCYDLRFPVWSRNKNNSYDLLLYTANWPDSRIAAWEILLQARAIENMAYVCGVNRVGTDGNNLFYSGRSLLFDPKGRLLGQGGNKSEEACITLSLSKDNLDHFRQKFPVWEDADAFTID